VLIIVCNLTPCNLARDVEADRVLWGPNELSIPALIIICFTHLGTVLLEIPPKGLTVEIKSLLPVQRCSVLFKYSFNTLTMHIFVLLYTLNCIGAR
jgi:hypothetical protein